MFSDEVNERINIVFKEALDSYESKGESETDKEWLQHFLMRNIKDSAKAEEIAEKIVSLIDEMNKDIVEIQNAEKQGISKEKWLSQKINEGVDMSDENDLERLKAFDELLYRQNKEMEGGKFGLNKE